MGGLSNLLASIQDVRPSPTLLHSSTHPPIHPT